MAADCGVALSDPDSGVVSAFDFLVGLVCVFGVLLDAFDEFFPLGHNYILHR